PVFYTTGKGPDGVVLGDVTGDGVPDLVTTNDLGNSITVFAGDGAGGFGARVDLPTGSHPAEPLLADLHGDGRLDLAYILETFGGTMVRFGTPGGLGPEVSGPSVSPPPQLRPFCHTPAGPPPL